MKKLKKLLKQEEQENKFVAFELLYASPDVEIDSLPTHEREAAKIGRINYNHLSSLSKILDNEESIAKSGSE